MDFVELYQRAMREDGLSANFNGQQQKKEIEMGKMIENRTFSLVINNNTGKDVCFALMTGSMPDIEEIKKRYPQVDAILADGDFYSVNGESASGEVDPKTAGTKTINCRCSGDGTIAYFRKYFEAIPAQITSMEMISSMKENFFTDVEVCAPNPCGIEQMKRKTLSAYLGTQQIDQNRVIANNINVPLSAAHLVLFTVKNGSMVTYNFTITSLY